jgi:predicted esterase
LETRTVGTPTHGRYLVDIPGHSRATLVGFHGYKENAATHLEALRQIANGREIGLVSVQGLHRFYTRANEVVAGWMTREDRELAIADNTAYVANVLSAVAEEFGITRPLIYVGFSQGVAMAYRAAAFVQRSCDGIIALAGDVPPDVAPLAASLPKVLLGRGAQDKWYDAGKAAADLAILKPSVEVVEHVFDAGHAWDPSFIARAGEFVDELSS